MKTQLYRFSSGLFGFVLGLLGNVMLAHLYIAARLGHVLPELSQLAYRWPWVAIEGLAQRLGKRDLELAE